jgi:hypothetical protein
LESTTPLEFSSFPRPEAFTLTPLPTLRLKTKLVLAITGLIFLVVTVLSWVFLDELLEQRISVSYAGNLVVAHQILYSTRLALEEDLRGKVIDANDPTALRKAMATALQQDKSLEALLASVIRYSPTVFDVSIADAQGRALVSTDPMLDDQILPPEPDYQDLMNGGVLPLVHAVFGPPRVYSISLTLDSNNHPIAIIRVVTVGLAGAYIYRYFRSEFPDHQCVPGEPGLEADCRYQPPA